MPEEKIMVLNEEVDENYVPTEREIDEYAEWLGMDKETEADLWWIAKDGLSVSLPAPWKTCEAGSEIFYFNPETGASVWDHPCDKHFKTLLATERQKKAEAKSAAAEPVVQGQEASKDAEDPPEPKEESNQSGDE
eukprot:CAMPEP_0204339600 /NCGR_PEP_ID=MMETSP0469-20131031/21929_1 /ASSEMBLY_ACC=CAM_ASM_000384 /TAXON_ID=2969 /ORGANISM="Oxyrrhis marina" /LENGTH=134 /DNA_ID=CAMNT_0051323969 /DNA_START=23 /DNA_END=424 /DNA_ORIENTATION=-